jgi:hypothetical protein
VAIHQIQFSYDQHQDRVLMRLSTMEGEEFRFWLTRLFTRRLWGLLVKLLEMDRPVRQQVDPDSKRAVLGLQHEGFTQQGNFSAPFEERAYRRPLGDEPLLLARAEGQLREDGTFLLRLHPQPGQGIDMTLDAKLLHLFSKLLNQVVAKTDWDVKLELFEGREPPAERQEAAPRKLN